MQQAIYQIFDGNKQTIFAYAKEWTMDAIRESIDMGTMTNDEIVHEEKEETLFCLAFGSLCRAYERFNIFNINDIDFKYRAETGQVLLEIKKEIKWLSENYAFNNTDINMKPYERKKILQNTLKFLKTLPDNTLSYCTENIKTEFNDLMYVLECKIDSLNMVLEKHRGQRREKDLLDYMEYAGIHKILYIDLLGDKKELYYPEIIDIFRDAFLLKCAFSDEDENKKAYRIIRNIRNNSKKKISVCESASVESRLTVSLDQKFQHMFEMFVHSLGSKRTKVRLLFHFLFITPGKRQPNYLLGKLSKNLPDGLRLRKYSKLC